MGEFSASELTLCADFYPVSVPPHIKDPGRSAKSAGGRLPLTTHTPLTRSDWADNAAVQAQCGNLSGNELTHNTQLVREHLITVVSARCATVDRSWHKRVELE